MSKNKLDKLIQKVLFDEPVPLTNYKTPKTLIKLDKPIKITATQNIDEIVSDIFSNDYQEFKQDTLKQPLDEKKIQDVDQLINDIYNYEYANNKSISNCEIKISSYKKLELAYNKIMEQRTSLAQSLIYAQLEKEYILTDIKKYLQESSEKKLTKKDVTEAIGKQIEDFRKMLLTVLKDRDDILFLYQAIINISESKKKELIQSTQTAKRVVKRHNSVEAAANSEPSHFISEIGLELQNLNDMLNSEPSDLISDINVVLQRFQLLIKPNSNSSNSNSNSNSIGTVNNSNNAERRLSYDELLTQNIDLQEKLKTYTDSNSNSENSRSSVAETQLVLSSNNNYILKSQISELLKEQERLEAQLQGEKERLQGELQGERERLEGQLQGERERLEGELQREIERLKSESESMKQQLEEYKQKLQSNSNSSGESSNSDKLRQCDKKIKLLEKDLEDNIKDLQETEVKLTAKKSQLKDKVVELEKKEEELDEYKRKLRRCEREMSSNLSNDSKNVSQAELLELQKILSEKQSEIKLHMSTCSNQLTELDNIKREKEKLLLEKTDITAKYTEVKDNAKERFEQYDKRIKKLVDNNEYLTTTIGACNAALEAKGMRSWFS